MWSLSIYFTLTTLIGSSFGAFICPRARGLFPDPENCARFYNCDNNVAHRQFCPPGSLFDGARLQCVNRHEKVACGPQPTTEPTTTTVDPLAAPRCDPVNCELPSCFCSPDGTRIPGGLKPKEVPQLIMITFDGALNDQNYEKYNQIFLDNRTNPNGCPIRSTFFITHEYSDYSKVQQVYSDGHEVSVASVTRRQGLENEPLESWLGEMVTMKDILEKYAFVDKSRVFGMRAPHIKPGKNTQYEMSYDYGFLWDSSMAVPPIRVPVWPYTLDYAIPHECRSGTCPTHSFPGLWEIPFNSHYQNNAYEGGYCPYLDQCVLNFYSEHEIVEWLKADFHRHLNSNRAPYLMSLSVNWFNIATQAKALESFIDYTLSLPEVYFVTMTESLQWISQPWPLSDIVQFEKFGCTAKDETLQSAKPCQLPNSCRLHLKENSIGLKEGFGGLRYMATCGTCPRVYPWVADAGGKGGNHKDTFTKVSYNYDYNYDDVAADEAAL